MVLTRFCDNCGKMVPRDITMYHIKIDIFADPSPPEITEEDLKEDHLNTLNQIIEEMEGMDPQEVTDQVYESYKFNLCSECRDDFHKKLKLTGKQQLFDD